MQKNLYFSEDITEFLLLLFKHNVRCLIVGDEAVLFHGHTRLTGEIDIFYDNSDVNVDKLYNALLELLNNDIVGLKEKSELKEEGIIIQFGIPPNRIDLMNKIETVNFNEANNSKITDSVLLKMKKQRLIILA